MKVPCESDYFPAYSLATGSRSTPYCSGAILRSAFSSEGPQAGEHHRHPGENPFVSHGSIEKCFVTSAFRRPSFVTADARVVIGGRAANTAAFVELSLTRQMAIAGPA